MTDENGHLWVGISKPGSGNLVEIDPNTDSLISTIGRKVHKYDLNLAESIRKGTEVASNTSVRFE